MLITIEEMYDTEILIERREKKNFHHSIYYELSIGTLINFTPIS